MEKRSERGRDARGDRGGKRKYEPPEIRSQEIFETTALACGKIASETHACMSVMRS
jgi:hypothetical protein